MQDTDFLFLSIFFLSVYIGNRIQLGNFKCGLNIINDIQESLNFEMKDNATVTRFC